MAKYKDYTGNNAYFINPYNFVNVDFKSEPARTDESERKANVGSSGVLHCKLITRTPLSIPDTAEADLSKKHKEYDFMRNAEGVPMIPGSSIRGAIRSVYEALTNSCMSTVDENQSITYRTKDPFEPGLLLLDDHGEYHLYRAKRFIFGVRGGAYARYDKEPELFSLDISKLKEYEYGDTVYISAIKTSGKNKPFKTSRGYPTKSIFIKEMTSKKQDGLTEGYICIGEPFARKKHFESVFVKGEEIILPKHDNNTSMLAKPVRDLNEIINIYNDEKVNSNAKTGSFYKNRDYKILKKGKYYPVWYKLFKRDEVIENIHLSVANIGRAAYHADMGDMLSEYISCDKRNAVCPACSLFGMVGTESMGSRVRFSDALMDRPVEKTGRVVLKELSSPKISYMPFYLISRNGEYDKDISYDNEAYDIRGRKFYWHNTNKNTYIEQNGKNERNSSVELIGKDNTFSFDVYYDCLSQEEIDRLIWTLSLGENDEKGKYCHKIGHGKPIGLGSVKIVINARDERTYKDGEYMFVNSSNPAVKKDLFNDSQAVGQILEITDIDCCKYPVEYPAIVDTAGKQYHDGSNNHASHQWFTSNFSMGNSPEKVLPEIGKENDEKFALSWKMDAGNSFAEKKTSTYIKYNTNEIYSGKVFDYNEFKTQAKIKLENGGKAILFYKDIGAKQGKIDKALPVDTSVKIKYRGKNEKGFDSWEIVRK